MDVAKSSAEPIDAECMVEAGKNCQNPDMLDGRDIPSQAERLRVAREALGLSQAELCRQTGISTQSWNNAETGDNRLGIDNVLKLSQYGITPQWVYHGDRTHLPANLLEYIVAYERRGTIRRSKTS